MGILTILILTSCGKTNVPRTLVFDEALPASFLKNNAVQYNEDRFNGYTKFEKFQTYEAIGNVASVDFNGNYSVSYALKRTYAVFSVIVGEETKYGVYDFKTRREVVLPDYDNILLVEVNYYNAKSEESLPYVYAVLRQDDRFGTRAYHSLYSINEQKEVMSEENTSMRPYYMISTERLGNHTVETITENPNLASAYAMKYKVHFDVQGSLSRSLIIENEDKIVTPAKTYVTESPSLIDYSYEFLATKVIGYLNDVKKFETPLPLVPLDTIVSKFTFDKYLVMQLSTPVAPDASDYTFYTEGDKYIMTTSLIDLTNGKVTNLNKFPYFITPTFNSGKVYLQKDASLKKMLGILSISKVEDKILLTPNLVLFNSEMKPLVNLTTINYSPTYYDLGNNRFLTINGEIVDENHQKLLDLKAYSNISYIPGHNLISLRYGSNYGIINSSGDIIAPFSYNSASTFYNGYTINHDSSIAENVRISADGTSTWVGSEMYRYSSDPALLYRRYGGETTYYNYLETPLFTIADNYQTLSQTFIYSQTGERFGKLYVVYKAGGEVDKFVIY